MGAGASASHGKGASSGKGKKKSAPSPSTSQGEKALTAALGSKEEATKLFKRMDLNKNGKLSVDEIKDAVSKQGKSFKEAWTPRVIQDVVAFFDRDKDGELDEAEFTEVLAELTKRGKVSIDPAALKKQQEHVAVFDKYKSPDETFERKHLAKLIRDINDEESIWDDNSFGPFIKSSFAALAGSEDRKAVGSREQFLAWYPGFEAEVEGVKAQRAAEAEAREAAKKAAGKAGGPQFSGEVWSCPMSKLEAAYGQCWEEGKTPLLIDCTTPADEDRNAGFSPLETFFSYSGEGLVELKKAVVETGVKKEKTVEAVQAELAKTLCMCLKQGRRLMLLCSNSAPPIASKFACPKWPLDILDATALKAVLGPDVEYSGTWVGPVQEWCKESGLSKDPAFGFMLVNDKVRLHACCLGGSTGPVRWPPSPPRPTSDAAHALRPDSAPRSRPPACSSARRWSPSSRPRTMRIS